VLRLENITKVYATDLVLENITWEIKRGEKVGLVGSNGAGKTTQLKIITGEEEQTSGSVIKDANLKISYLSQEFDLNMQNTVREELSSAFIEIQSIRTLMNQLERKMVITKQSNNQEDLNKLINQVGIYQRKFEGLGGYNISSKIDKILPKLGFSSKEADELVSNFSCGWQMKIALGKVMLLQPDLLLLDEPTNHLDLDTINWLEQYLLPLKTAIIVISHDRYFLDKLCQKIIFIEKGTSITYKGNYSFFLKQKSLDEESQSKSYQLQQKELEIQKKYIERFRASATRSTQAKSREKQISKIIKLDNITTNNKVPTFNFPHCKSSGKLILEIKNLCHGYSDKIIFFETNLKIFRGEKIAFLGPNGVGKSTLFKLIMQQIIPEIGEINLGKHNLITSYYQQNQSEALDSHEIVIDLIFAKVPDWSQKKVRTFLGGFGFYKESVFKTISQLSGGEKARLAMALIILQPSNFLLLDEPTNHLDLQCKENLETAINDYKGTVLIISHDRFFISRVANRIIEINDSQLQSFNGNYEYYLEKKAKMKRTLT
tara:strand:+ start:1688 stop:3322 length:1635 start_codon:yes stop_codon:yes gene_type:complete